MFDDCEEVSLPSPDLIGGLTGQSSIPGRWLLDRQSKSDASDFDHLVSAEVGQARLRVKPGNGTGKVNLMEKALVLLRYKLLRARFRAVPPQHGHRGNRLTIAAMSLRRMVAIEFGMCRSGRKGGSSGSVTVGYGKLREQRGGTRS